MDQAFNFFKTTMPETRKTKYHLGCLDSSVFIDFDCSNENQIYMVRISFDGYGCCNLEDKSECLNLKDSQEFIEEFEKENFNQVTISRLVKELININKDHIWTDALKEYGLIK